jgi:hypothetical protein
VGEPDIANLRKNAFSYIYIYIYIYGSLESNEFWEQGVGGWIEALGKLVLYIAF